MKKEEEKNILAVDDSTNPLTEEQIQAIDEALQSDVSADGQATAAEKAQTFAEGAASGLTFGISDQIIDYDRLESERQEAKERTERTQGYRTGGEVGGIVAGMFGPGAIGAGVKGVAKVGLGAEKLTEKALASILKNKANKSAFKNFVQKSTAKGVGSGVEGSFYGAGQLVKEDALGDADFNAENLISYAGTGAALGAGLGYGLSAAGGLLKGTGKGVNRLTGVGGKFVGTPQKAALELFGFKPSEISKILNNRPKLADDILAMSRDRINMKPWSSTENMVNGIKDINKNANDALDNIYEQLSASGVGIPARSFYRRVADHLEENLVNKYQTKGTATPGYETLVRKAKKAVKKYRQIANIDGDELLTASMLRKIRQEQDALVKYTRGDLVDQLPYTVRNFMRSQIDELAETAAIQNPAAASIAKDLKIANRDVHVSKEILDRGIPKIDKDSLFKAQDFLLGGVGYGVGGLPGAVLAGIPKFMKSDLKRKLTILANIERSNKQVESAISGGLKKFFSGATKPIVPISTKTLLESSFTKDEKGAKPKKPATKQEAIDNLQENTLKMTTDPEYMEQRILPKYAALTSVAPETANEAVNTIMRAADFLSQKMKVYQPKKNNLFSRKITMSDIEMDKITKYLEAIENPLSMIEKLQEGTLTRAHVEALSTVYPNLYQRIQNQTMDYITTHQDMPYSKKIQLGILLDIPADSSLSNEAILNTQAMYVKEEEGRQAMESQAEMDSMVEPSQTGLKNLSYESRAQTATQAVAQRSIDGE